MADLRERFEVLARTHAPDLWREIESREPRPAPSPRRRRALAAAVALLVAAGGMGLAALTFGGSERPRVPATPADGLANGPILYRVGGEGGSTWYSVMADGSDRQVVFESEPMRIAQIAWSPDGTRIAYQDPIVDERGIFVANADGSGPARLTEGWNDGWPSWSPDGSKIVFTRTSVPPGDERCIPGTPHEFRCPTDIYVMDADGSNIVRLTDHPAGEFMPMWSPDGSRIAFAREGDVVAGAYEAIYTMRSDGTDVRQVSSASGGSDFWPSWSPDGSRIVFAAIRNEDWGIWVVNADGSNEHPILGGAIGYVNNPVWSPDGNLIAFVGNLWVDDYSPNDALYVMRPDGTGVTPIADAPDGIAGDLAWQPIPVPAESVEPEPSPVPTTAEIVGTFEVGEDVRSVAYGEGSVWVAVSNDDGTFAGRILRIDPVTHDLQAEILVEVIPTWEVGGGAIVVHEGSLWVAGGLEAPGDLDDPGGGADAAVIRIDASTNEVAQTIELGGQVGADLAFLDGETWVLLFGDETVDNRMEVVRVDPETGEVLARVPLASRWAHTIVAAGGRLLVSDRGSMLSIDPATNAIAGREEMSTHAGPVLARGEVWAVLAHGFGRFDPATAQLVARSPELDQSRYAVCCRFIAGDARGIWFLGYDGIEGQGPTRLDVFDPVSGGVTELTALDEGTPVAMAVAPDGVWILNHEGTLTHVSLG